MGAQNIRGSFFGKEGKAADLIHNVKSSPAHSLVHHTHTHTHSVVGQRLQGHVWLTVPPPSSPAVCLIFYFSTYLGVGAPSEPTAFDYCSCYHGCRRPRREQTTQRATAKSTILFTAGNRFVASVANSRCFSQSENHFTSIEPRAGD